jgi:hypothetical protein
MPTLADIYSAINTAKRKGSDFVQNPGTSLQQMLGNANDQARGFNQLNDQVLGEMLTTGKLTGPAGQQLMQTIGDAYNPVGMTTGALPTSKSYDLFKEWVDESPSKVLQTLQNRIKNDAKDYEIKMMDVSKIKPTQFGEDAVNDSSKFTAQQIQNAKSIENVRRREDVLPIKIDEKGNIVDGNHRYAAALMNNEKYIPVLYPIGSGKSQITNFKLLK